MLISALAAPASAASAKPKTNLAPEMERRVIEVLKEALSSRDALAQGRALLALNEIGDKEAIARAKEALQEENWGILQYALRIAAFTGKGRKVGKAFPAAAVRALENPRTRPHAFELLEEVDPKLADAALRQALEAEDGLRNEVIRRSVDRGDERAVAVLGHALKSKKKGVRPAAIKALAKLRGKAATDFVMKLAGGKDTEVRDAALEALLDSREEAVKPFLAKLLGSTKDKAFKLRVAKALAQRGERALVLPTLKAAAEGDDKAARVAALEGLAEVGDRVVAIGLRGVAVNPKEEPDVAVAALKVLGGSGDVANLPTLRKALATDHLHLRVGAMTAIGLLKRPEGIADAARGLFDGNKEVRLAAAIALGRIGGAEVVPYLDRAVFPETDPEVQKAIVEALGRSGDPSGVSALQIHMVNKGKPVLVGAAVDAMLEIGDPAAVNIITLAVDPAYPEVMEKAVKAICLLDESQGIMALTAYLQRFSLPFVHDLNAEAGPRAVVFLERFVAAGTPPQRALALDLLLRRGEKGLAVVRKAAKSNTDQGIRRTALMALAARGDKRSLDLFTASLDDPDAGIKGIGLEAVARLTEGDPSEAVRAKVEQLMEDAAPSVRVAAAHTLYGLAAK